MRRNGVRWKVTSIRVPRALKIVSRRLAIAVGRTSNSFCLLAFFLEALLYVGNKIGAEKTISRKISGEEYFEKKMRKLESANLAIGS